VAQYRRAAHLAALSSLALSSHTTMILLHSIVAVLLLLITLSTAHTTEILSERSTSNTDLPAKECIVAPSDSFNDKAGTRYQLIAVGPTNPNGAIQTYQNSAIPELLTFRLGISAISPQAMDITLVNFKSGYAKAPKNTEKQVARYKLNLFDRKGLAHETMLWLAGHDKCRYTIQNPVNIDERFVLNVVVMNTV
jgi:hypothetical protein